MSNAGIAIGLAAVALLGLVCVPRLVRWLVRWRALRRREAFENALKHLLSCKHDAQAATAVSLAGVLQLSPARVVALVAGMEAEGVVESSGGELHLTFRGERWALRVVRAHRLWERYLADEAGMPLADVHRAAERAEHRLTVQQLNVLDAHLGYPRRDPHGDPIPNASGEVEPLRATPLTDWAVDEPARIVPIEDEPDVVFQQVVAQGLRPGQIVRVLHTGAQRLILSDGQEEYRLAPVAAANVQVVTAPAIQPQVPEGVVRLCELQRDREAEVVGIDDACRGLTRRRLLDLGLTRGARIKPELVSAFGEPRAFQVRGTLVTLRRQQAALVWVRTDGSGRSADESGGGERP